MFSVKINDDSKSDFYIKLYVKLPNTYPLESPPSFEFSAPYLNKASKTYLSNALEETYL